MLNPSSLRTGSVKHLGGALCAPGDLKERPSPSVQTCPERCRRDDKPKNHPEWSLAQRVRRSQRMKGSLSLQAGSASVEKLQVSSQSFKDFLIRALWMCSCKILFYYAYLCGINRENFGYRPRANARLSVSPRRPWRKASIASTSVVGIFPKLTLLPKRRIIYCC